MSSARMQYPRDEEKKIYQSYGHDIDQKDKFDGFQTRKQGLNEDLDRERTTAHLQEALSQAKTTQKTTAVMNSPNTDSNQNLKVLVSHNNARDTINSTAIPGLKVELLPHPHHDVRQTVAAKN